MSSTYTSRIDGVTTSVAVKAPCRVVTNANITLSGEQTINSVAVVEGDRVLVKDQSTASENGIYVVSTTAWTRAKDFNGPRDAVRGTLCFAGAPNDGNFYAVDTADGFVIGTDNISFVEWNFADPSDIAAIIAIATEIAQVAAIDGDVTAVAGISADVTAVAAIDSDISIVAANITDIQNAEENADIAKAAGGFTYTYSSTTASADPGAGFIRLNNADISSATELYISETTALAQAIAAELATWDDSTSTIRTKLRLFKQSDPSVFVLLNITGTLTDNGGWDTFTVSYVAGATSLANNDVLTIQPIRNGDKGDIGNTGAAGSLEIANAGGTVDAITADFTPDLSIVDNLVIQVVNTAGPNTVVNPTLNTDGSGALTIKARGNAALVAGDTGAAGYTMTLRYEATGTYWELQNPAKVIEADIVLADNTTNNASTSAHGFLKKLSNVATEFMNGAGDWAVPAGGGAVNRQTFATVGADTWTKPTLPGSASDYFVKITCIPAGGSGASRTSTGSCSGGAGGGYHEVLLELAAMDATEDVVIGAGGSGVSGNTAGNTGGTSSITIGANTLEFPGGEGGVTNAVSTLTNGGSPQLPTFAGTPAASSGGGAPDCGISYIIKAGDVGGLGTGISASNLVSGPNGDYQYVGGGGSSCSTGSVIGLPGKGWRGGDGGAANAAGAGSPGVAPGGGGGASRTGTSGAGARGEMIVEVLKK